MTHSSDETNPVDSRATAQYIEAMARDLKGLASGSGLSFLVFLLGMVEEASGIERKADRKRDGNGKRS